MRRELVIVIEERDVVAACEAERGVGVSADAAVLPQRYDSNARITRRSVCKNVRTIGARSRVRETEFESAVGLTQDRVDAARQGERIRIEHRHDDRDERPEAKRLAGCPLSRKLRLVRLVPTTPSRIPIVE